MYYIIVVHGSLDFIREKELHIDQIYKPISVIICARNEANNLQKFLPQILNQDYKEYEVIVVNDCSFDESENILKEFLQHFPDKLKVVNIEEHPRYKTAKKFAATMGIKAAKYDYLLFTDADCLPNSDQWILNMAKYYSDNTTEIILGYSPYIKKVGFLNRIIRYETLITAINYLSYAVRGNPYMGVGRNLSYKKELFFKGKGFASHMHIPSGDDDLFVNQHAKKQNTKIVVNESSWTWSEPKTTFASFWKQKTRHLGAGRFYKKKHQRQLFFQFISGMLFYALFILLLAFKFQLLFASIIFLAMLFLKLFCYTSSFKKLGCGDLTKWLIILDPIYYIILFVLSLFGLFKKSITWK